MRVRPMSEWPVVCGLDCPKGELTLDQVAVILGCTRERVRQIEAHAMQKLVAAMRKRFRGATSSADFVGTDDGV